jgi:hypothetical protein
MDLCGTSRWFSRGVKQAAEPQMSAHLRRRSSNTNTGAFASPFNLQSVPLPAPK